MKTNEIVNNELKTEKTRLIFKLKTICNAINNEYRINGKSLHYKALNISKNIIKEDIKILNKKIITSIEILNVFRFSAP